MTDKRRGIHRDSETESDPLTRTLIWGGGGSVTWDNTLIIYILIISGRKTWPALTLNK